MGALPPPPNMLSLGDSNLQHYDLPVITRVYCLVQRLEVGAPEVPWNGLSSHDEGGSVDEDAVGVKNEVLRGGRRSWSVMIECSGRLVVAVILGAFLQRIRGEAMSGGGGEEGIVEREAQAEGASIASRQ